MAEKQMSLTDAAQLALDVQDAVNLSGVLRSFSRVVSEALWPVARDMNMATDWVNTHPICTLFLAKLSDLNRMDADWSKFGDAYQIVKQIAGDRQ